MRQTEDFVRMLSEETGLTYEQLDERAGFKSNMARKIAEGWINNPAFLTLDLLARGAGMEIILHPKNP